MERFYVIQKLGRKQSLTPEGFLLCEDVPIARTGEMYYGPDETPIKAVDGVARVTRDEDEVFAPRFLASLNGKPIVNEHPEDDVTPENWKEYAIGTVLNPRRGKGVDDDLLLADFLITDKKAIEEVRTGKREVSVGYDSDYEATAPAGRGRQKNMIANHVALVDSGRCGSRCAIGDKATVKESTMAKTADKSKVAKFLDSMRNAFKAKDEAAFEQALEDGKAHITGAEDEATEGGSTSGELHVHVHPHSASPVAAKASTDAEEGAGGGAGEQMDNTAIMARLDEICKRLDALEGGGEGQGEEVQDVGAFEGPDGYVHPIRGSKGYKKSKTTGDDNKEIEGALEEEAPEGTGDKARKAKDSLYLVDSFHSTVALAEIVSPGIQVPTFDRAHDPRLTFTNICKLRRKALDTAYVRDAKTAEMIEGINGGKKFDSSKMTCGAVRAVFLAVAHQKRTKNNDASFTGVGADLAAVGAGGGMGVFGNIKTNKDLNTRNREYWKGR